MSALVNRRRVLFGLAASTAISVPVSAAVAAPAVIENAELMHLDGEFRAAYAAYLGAHERKMAARSRCEAIAPVIPSEIIHEGGEFGRGLTAREQDCEGREVWPADPKRQPRRIYSSDEVYRVHGPLFDRPTFRRRKNTLRMKAIHAAAKQYEEAVAAAIEASGLTEALRERKLAVDGVRRVFWKIAEQEAYTVAGLLTKANSLACFAATGEGEAASAKLVMGTALADDILTVFGQPVQS